MKPWLHPVRRFLARFGKPHVILPISFLNSTACTIVGFGFVYYLRDGYGARGGSIGLAAALYSGLYFAGCFVLRPLTTRLLPRHSAILSSLLSAAALIVIVAVSDLAATVVLYGVFGFGLALFWPPVMGWLSAGSEGNRLNRVIGRFNLAWSVGSIVGPYLAGLLVEIDLRLPLVVGAGIVLVNAVAIGAASAFVGSIRGDRYLEQTPGPTAGPDGGTPLRFPSWIGIMAGYATLGVILVVFPLYGRDALGLPESAVGGVFLLRGLATAGVFVLAGRTGWWQFKRPVIPAPGLALAVILAVMLLAGSPLAYGVLIMLAGAPVAAAYTLSVFNGAAGSVDRTRRMAIHEALLTLGTIIGSSAGGWLYQHHGWSAAVSFCLGLVALSVAVQIAMLGVLRNSGRGPDATAGSPGRGRSSPAARPRSPARSAAHQG